jgi:arylsulfatase A-like enzyme
MTDDQGCDQHSSYLCDQVRDGMPFLASMPGNDWYVARQARTHNSLCCPNRGTTLTGQTSLHNGILGNSSCKDFDEREYLPVALQRAGYSTGHFGKFLNCYPNAHWKERADGTWPIPAGWDRFVGHIGTPSYYAFDVVDDGVDYIVPNTGPNSYEPYWFRDQLIEWVDQQNGPWFAYYTPFGPHSPSDVAPGYTTSMSKVTPDIPNFREGCPGAFDPSNADKPSFYQSRACTGSRGNGKGAQWGVDQAFKSIYQHLAALGQLENTVILFLSDNGMALGSHRLTGKECAYEVCHTIPFMLKVPGMPGGTLERMVSNLDITPTLLELAGGSTTRLPDGLSLLPLLSDPNVPWRDDQFLWNQAERYRAIRDDCAVRNPCWLYVEYMNGERELYDLQTDPFQLNQLLPNSVTGYPGDPAWTDPANPLLLELEARLAAAYVQGGGGVWPDCKPGSSRCLPASAG